MNNAFQQQQFLNVIDRDEAEQRFRAALDLTPLETERIPLVEALGRVLAEDIRAPVDVPGFDRSNVDGFAVRAADTFGASEDRSVSLLLVADHIVPGKIPSQAVVAGAAFAIATGAMLPRGADAVVMIEQTNIGQGKLVVSRPVPPGANVSFTGSDIGRGETVLRRGELLTSRETGVLAAVGIAEVPVVRRPRVAILSTGDELVAPGHLLPTGAIYDSNAAVLADAVRELGGVPVLLGIIPDDRDKLLAAMSKALSCDVVLMSGGTSKGAGDLSYRVLEDFGPPGILAHGVALKPGKPLCLAALRRPKTEEKATPHPALTPKRGEGEEVPSAKGRSPSSPPSASGRGQAGGVFTRPIPVAVLPGFPTSAIFTFHEFLAPVIRLLGGRPERGTELLQANLAVRVNSERGRTEYLLVNLVESTDGLIAYPMGKGSGSVTAFSKADGFITIPRQREYLEANAEVSVELLGGGLMPAELIVIGSHCTGLDDLLGRLHDRGVRSKFIAVGSSGGLEACRRGECDVAGIHLLDPMTNVYNHTLLPSGVRLLEGYGRSQGIIYRRDDVRFRGKSITQIVEMAVAHADCILANRNRGSGTRVLIDQMLGAARPTGYQSEAKSHQAVAAAVAQVRADWGVAIEQVARENGLAFLPVREERYDFAIPELRWNRPTVKQFRALLDEPATRQHLAEMGFSTQAQG